MARFLATFHSPLSARGAIGIIDSEYGLSYLQVDDLPDWVITPQLRGIACQGSDVYITTPAGVQIYSVIVGSDKPLFQRKNEISLHEWMLGAKLQADLLGILISSTRKQLLVANNFFNSVDEFTLDGSFTKRHFLFEIAPDQFPVPEAVDVPFRYGHIRHIGEAPDGSVLLTISSMNGSERGCVLNIDNGDVFLDNLQTPHGGFFGNDHYFIQDVRHGMLSAYPLVEERKIAKAVAWNVKPKITIPEYSESIQNMRGMVRVGSTIFCGVCNLGNSLKKEMPARIVSFDINTGRQKATEIFFPDLEEFRQARVFLLAPLPSGLEDVIINDFTFFLNGERKEVVSYTPIKSKKKNDVLTLNVKQKTSIKSESSPAYHPDNGIVPPRQPVVTLNNVSLSYRRNVVSPFSFKKNLRASIEFQALRGVSFTIYEGETVGVVGRNGSGKSTISMLISGALPPDKGTLSIRGRVQLLSLGLGFRNELTGRENVFINGALLGLKKKEILRHLPEIEAFAELDDFIDEPVRTYSAGMRSRLGFAVATVVSPDILILDEVLSTGDAAFRRKADERMQAMRERTKTIIIVSHSVSQVRKMCSRVVWLNKGAVVMEGEPDLILSEYNSFCANPQDWLYKNKIDADAVHL